MSQYLIQPKRLEQLRARVKDMCSSRAADNIIKVTLLEHDLFIINTQCVIFVLFIFMYVNKVRGICLCIFK